VLPGHPVFLEFLMCKTLKHLDTQRSFPRNAMILSYNEITNPTASWRLGALFMKNYKAEEVDLFY